MEILIAAASLWYTSGVGVCLLANFVNKKHQAEINTDDIFALVISAVIFPIAGLFILAAGIEKVQEVINETD